MSLNKSLTSPAIGLGAALCGLLIALISALGIDDQVATSDAWIAQINGIKIPASEYDRALIAMQDGVKRSLTEQDRQKALQVLIDEELLLQEAEAIGLLRSDPVIRKNLIQAMIKASTSFSEAEPNEQQLKKFYSQHQSLFISPMMITIVSVGSSSEETIMVFKEALEQGENFTSAAERLNLEKQNIPAQIPLAKLSNYIGGQLAQQLVKLETGSIAGPVQQAGFYRVFWIQQKTGAVGSFETMRQNVISEWKRRASEQTFQDYLDNLRRRARISLAVEQRR